MKLRIVPTGLLLVALLAAPALAGGIFQDLPLPPSYGPQVLTLSYDGLSVGGTWIGPMIYEVSTGTMVTIDPSAYGDYAPAIGGGYISGDGRTLTLQVVDSMGTEYPAYWNEAEGLVILPLAPESTFCGPYAMSAWGTNFDGTVHVGLGWENGCEASGYIYKTGDAAAVYLGKIGSEARASVVSGDGTVVGGWAYYPGSYNRAAALWFDGDSEPTMLFGEDEWTEVMAVSHDGTKAAGQATGGALYWDETVGPVNIGALPGDEAFGAYANDISNDGKVVGQSGSMFWGVPRAFIWTPDDGMMYLGDYLAAQGVTGVDGIHFVAATGISDDGNVIVGTYQNADWMQQAFIVDLQGTVGIDDRGEPEGDGNTLPSVTRLMGAYPNPFNPSTSIKFTLEHSQNVNLSVYDLSGRLVAELANETFSAGEHSIRWQGRDTSGRAVASGTYLAFMITDERVRTSKMMLVR